MKNTLLFLLLVTVAMLQAQEDPNIAGFDEPGSVLPDTIAPSIDENEESEMEDDNEVLPEANADSFIHWMSLREAETAQATEPKKIFIHLYSSWCRWCRLSDSVVFRHPVIAQLLNRHFYPVRLNGETPETIHFRGNDYRSVDSDGHRVHELTDWLLRGKISYPGYAFLNEEEELIYASNGYLSPAELETVLHYCHTGACYEEDFTEFEKNFLGKIPE